MMRALGWVVGHFTPWLIEFGSWIFAGLLAFILFMLAPLITAGPVDRAVTIATAAFALALPVNLAGLFILRLIQDMQRIGFASEVARSFQEAGLPLDKPDAAPPEQEARQKSRINLVLLYALGILALSGLLTLTGIVAALWHMAWWIAVAFLVMLALSLGYRHRRARHHPPARHPRPARALPALLGYADGPRPRGASAKVAAERRIARTPIARRAGIRSARAE